MNFKIFFNFIIQKDLHGILFDSVANNNINNEVTEND